MFEQSNWNAPGDRQSVSFTERDRDDAARLLTLIIGKGRAQRDVQKFKTASVARAIVEDRKRRAELFNRGMFGEPGWELLLHLYIADSDGPRFTVGKLTQAAGIAQSTSLRWLDYLEDQRLIVRSQHPTDARTAFVTLTDKARDALTEYLSQTVTTQL